MKLKNILIGFTIIFVLLFANTVSAETTAPDSLQVHGSDAHLIMGGKYLNGSTIKLYYKTSSDGTVVYCTEINKNAVTYGTQTYTLSKKLDSSYAYIIENGYPNKKITGDNDKDYFITGLAIWYLSESNNSIFARFNFDAGTYNGQVSDVAQNVSKLLTGAKNYTYVTPSIKIYGNNSTFTLSSDKKYYVSSNLGVTTTGNIKNYTVSLEDAPSGTIITDINGTTNNVFSTDKKFVVKIPVTSINTLTNEFKINVSAEGSASRAYLYEPEDDQYQDVAILYSEIKKVNNTVTDTLNLTTKVEISKIDVANGQELPGATLTVKDEKGNVVDTWVSTNEVHVIENLIPGKYTLTEEIAPEGYELSTEIIEFEVKIDGTVTKVVMENNPKVKTPIYISKQDITTNEELTGAHLELRDEEGNLIEAWVSESTPHMIEGLAAGKYILTEILAPEGYKLSTETVEFAVNEDGTVDSEIIMYNTPQEVVEVPNTSSFKTITSSLIGIIIIGLGSMIIYKNYKKNEEY